MLELELDRESKFSLEMKIDGNIQSSEPPQLRFSIMGEGFIYSTIAERVENGQYEITLPALKGKFAEGEYAYNVEVFIEDRHFTPMSDKISLKEAAKPVVTIATKQEIKKEPTVTVTLGKVNENASKSESERLGSIIKKTNDLVKL